MRVTSVFVAPERTSTGHILRLQVNPLDVSNGPMEFFDLTSMRGAKCEQVHFLKQMRKCQKCVGFTTVFEQALSGSYVR